MRTKLTKNGRGWVFASGGYRVEIDRVNGSEWNYWIYRNGSPVYRVTNARYPKLAAAVASAEDALTRLGPAQ